MSKFLDTANVRIRIPSIICAFLEEIHDIAKTFPKSLTIHDTMDISISDQLPGSFMPSDDERELATAAQSNGITDLHFLSP